MTLKKLFLPIALFITATTAFAADISVTVKDKTTGEPIGYATVELLTPADSFLIGGMTNDNGFISIPCNAPECKIRISFMGYKTYEAPVTAQNMGVVFLEEDATQLSEVTVEASTRVTKIDRDVYVVTRDLKAGTATSRELLGKLNGVVYNPYDQSISFNGSTNILILVDGIETDQNMAKTLSPDRIERVEVIKDPVGKYAADGYRAVFNIMLKKDYSGIEVTANFNPMFNFVNRRGNPSSFMQENATLNILYTYKKLNLWGGYWGNHASELGMPVETVKQYGDLLVTTPPPDANHPDLKFINSADGAWLGGNYSLKEGNTLAFDLNYTGWSPRSTNVSDLTTSRNGVVIGRNQSITKTHNTNDALQATLTYKGKWSEKSSFEGDFRYRHSTPTNRSEFTQGAMQSVSYNSQIENFYRLNLAYSYQFSPKFSMDLGYGTMINHFNLYQNNTTLTQHQVRNRPSLYVNYAFSDKLNVKIGAMVEFYNQTFMDLEQTQTGFLPMVNVMYRPSDKFSVTAKYRANPGYPDINSLTTFMTQMDTLTWSVGNPNLEPGNFQEVTLDINFLKYFTVSPFYGFDARNSQQYLYEDNGQYFQRPVNANYKSLGANINFTLPLAKTLFWQNWARFSNAWLSYNDAENDQFSLQFSSMFIYSLPQWDATVGAGVQKYITRWGTLQGYSSGGNDIPLLMLQKNFFNKRLSCSLLYIPPIEAGFIKYSQDNMTRTPTYYSFNSAGLKLLHNVMLFQFTYRFSAGKQIKVTKSSLDDDTSVKQKSAGF
ncbi:MAG: TonB-dependent receptor family protein [Tannerella sp.]|jgi:hypothetical protein|nr:TonB-dependent receptor family protein [Tannerella sp.]